MMYASIMRILKNISNETVETAEFAKKGATAIFIQKHWRGALARMRNAEEVILIRRAREEFL